MKNHLRTFCIITITLVAASLISCKSTAAENVSTTEPTPSTIIPTPSPSSRQSDYGFPASIDPAKRYLFYLHGKIIEDQGLPAISPSYGEYEYEAILEKLRGHGFVVISEQRPKNTDGATYARKIKSTMVQVDQWHWMIVIQNEVVGSKLSSNFKDSVWRFIGNIYCTASSMVVEGRCISGNYYSIIWKY